MKTCSCGPHGQVAQLPAPQSILCWGFARHARNHYYYYYYYYYYYEYFYDYPYYCYYYYYHYSFFFRRRVAP